MEAGLEVLMHKCACSPLCGAQTARVFAPGHDTRLTGFLARAVDSGSYTLSEALVEGEARGASPLHMRKILHACLRAQARHDKRKGKS